MNDIAAFWTEWKELIPFSVKGSFKEIVETLLERGMVVEDKK